MITLYRVRHQSLIKQLANLWESIAQGDVDSPSVSTDAVADHNAHEQLQTTSVHTLERQLVVLKKRCSDEYKQPICAEQVYDSYQRSRDQSSNGYHFVLTRLIQKVLRIDNRDKMGKGPETENRRKPVLGTWGSSIERGIRSHQAKHRS